MRRPLGIALIALMAATQYWGAALWHFTETGFGDWQQFLHQWEAARVAYLRYGEVPLWNPYHCGGTLLFGDPQAQGFSPLFFLLMPLGSATGLKVFMILHTAVGFGGMYLFGRKHVKLDEVGASMAALVWAGSGFFAWHGSGGHPSFMPFYFAPLVLVAWRQAQRRWRYSVALAGIMALVIFEGGVYPFPFLVLLLIFDTLVTTRSRRDLRRVLAAGSLSALLTVLLAGYRLAGILTTIRDYPRPTMGNDSLSMLEVFQMLTVPDRDHVLPGQHEYVWAEYGSYIGELALVLALIGLVLSLRRHRWILAGSLLFGGLVLGNVTPFHPWPLIHSLPVYGSLRVPSRFMVLFLFFLALGGGLAITQLRRRGKRSIRWKKVVAGLSGVLLLAVAVQIVAGNGPVIDRWRGPPIVSMDDEGTYYITPSGEYGWYASFPARGVSTRQCYTGMTSYTAARGLWEGEVPQVRVRRGELLSESRTSQTISARVEVDTQSRVVFNQTWAPGWVSSIGELEQGTSGLIEVHGLEEGTHDVRIAFRPKEAAWGLYATLVGLLGALLILGTGFKRRRKQVSPVPSPESSEQAPA